MCVFDWQDYCLSVCTQFSVRVKPSYSYGVKPVVMGKCI